MGVGSLQAAEIAAFADPHAVTKKLIGTAAAGRLRERKRGDQQHRSAHAATIHGVRSLHLLTAMIKVVLTAGSIDGEAVETGRPHGSGSTNPGWQPPVGMRRFHDPLPPPLRSTTRSGPPLPSHCHGSVRCPRHCCPVAQV